MAVFDVWDIVTVPFPYTNRPIEQRRPALILAVIEAAESPVMLWVAMITSAANRAWPKDIPITDPHMAGLPAPSVIRLAKIATIELAAARQLGRLAIPDRPMARQVLAHYLAHASTPD